VTDDEIVVESSEAVMVPVAPKKKHKRNKITFERPPFANELFTEEMKKVFDKHPGYSRHFIKQYLITGNIKAAAKAANMSANVDLKESEDRSIKVILDKNGMGPDDLIVHLQDCLKAEGLIRDKHGQMHKTVDLKVKLSTIELILRLRGDIGSKEKPKKGKDGILEMFTNTNPDATD
jgi:hypothetical protein